MTKKAATGGGNLSFDQLVPKRDTFTDENGEVYEFVSLNDFTAQDVARVGRIQRSMASAQRFLEKNPKNKGALDTFDRQSITMLRIILPLLPKERAEALKFGQRASIANWWNTHNTPNGNGSGTGDELDDYQDDDAGE